MAKVSISKGSDEHHFTFTTEEQAAHCHFIETSEDLYRSILDNLEVFAAIKEIAESLEKFAAIREFSAYIREVAERLERTEPKPLDIWKVFQKSLKEEKVQKDKV